MQAKCGIADATSDKTKESTWVNKISKADLLTMWKIVVLKCGIASFHTVGNFDSPGTYSKTLAILSQRLSNITVLD